MTTFSICIPNFNYERYIAETLRGVLDQDFGDLEVLISDNASTDGSVEAVRAIADQRVQISVNNRNVGFAGNLDRAAQAARGDTMILLSSDDVMRPGALRSYADLLAEVDRETSLLCADVEVIDGDGVVTNRRGGDPTLWSGSVVDPSLSAAVGATVRSMPAPALLARCLRTMQNPFHFLTAAYPRSLYDAVEGYGGGRVYGPDKWFHWRLLGQAEMVYRVEAPLFAYRWHTANQAAQQSAEGALKYLVDDYLNTFEVDAELLDYAGVGRDEVVAAFVEYSIARHGLATLARGDRRTARRICDFGRATYPLASRRNRKMAALRTLTAAGPLGARIAAQAYARMPASDS